MPASPVTAAASRKSRKPAPRWARRKDARPDEILAAALEVFVERGYAATRLDEVASRAGVSKGTLYLYFENKEELFKAVVRTSILPMLANAEALIAHFPGPPEALLRELIAGWWRMAGGTKIAGIPKLVIAEAGNFPDLAHFYYDEVIQRGNRMFRRVLQRGIDSGDFREIDLDYTVRIMLAPLVMLALWQHSFACCEATELDPRRYLEAYLDALLHGLQRTTARPRAAKNKKEIANAKRRKA
jgi:AcrR family transcriptional regulator